MCAIGEQAHSLAKAGLDPAAELESGKQFSMQLFKLGGPK
jgi:hypothetical protein